MILEGRKGVTSEQRCNIIDFPSCFGTCVFRDTSGPCMPQRFETRKSNFSMFFQCVCIQFCEKVVWPVFHVCKHTMKFTFSLCKLLENQNCHRIWYTHRCVRSCCCGCRLFPGCGIALVRMLVPGAVLLWGVRVWYVWTLATLSLIHI